MHACTTVLQHDHAGSEFPLLQVLKNTLIVSQLGSGPRIVGRIGSGVRISASFKKLPARLLSHYSQRSIENTQQYTMAPLCVVSRCTLVNCRYLLPISWVG